MGNLENESRRRKRNENIQKAILASIKAAGVLSVALLAPNALKMFSGLAKNQRRVKERICRSRDRLVRAGLLQWNRRGYLELTQKGEMRLRKFEMLEYKFRKPKHWDKKWRILIFDIPEKKKSLREKVRATLIAIGLIRLQDSVWVYPYDCEDLVTLLKADFKIGKELLYIIADSIENDRSLKTDFKLGISR